MDPLFPSEVIAWLKGGYLRKQLSALTGPSLEHIIQLENFILKTRTLTIKKLVFLRKKHQKQPPN